MSEVHPQSVNPKRLQRVFSVPPKNKLFVAEYMSVCLYLTNSAKSNDQDQAGGVYITAYSTLAYVFSLCTMIDCFLSNHLF